MPRDFQASHSVNPSSNLQLRPYAEVVEAKWIEQKAPSPIIYRIDDPIDKGRPPGRDGLSLYATGQRISGCVLTFRVLIRFPGS